MNKTELFQQIIQKRSFLCVGLDSEMEKLPKHLLSEKDPVFSFNKAIIDATAQYAVAYKPNTAFYEVHGSKGWESLEKTIKYLKINYPEIFVIADAKRGDIGNTSVNYARAFFNHLDSDALTVAPYMGFDSVSPFLGFDEKWVILLALTSNSGSTDFQYNHQNSGKRLFEEVLTKAKTWANSEQMMFVVGATHSEEIAAIRQLVPDYFLLVPGVGAQGGSLEAVAENGLNDECGLLVNSSRGILYASSQIDFAEKAAEEAQKLQLQMEKVLLKKALI
ncbi:MAG: orotidine-5'-phosphate decarboxylase [Bacteroidales bacterium]|nr:orotidine-5'-phosphate decarboxylase [Bacteroidales bacterium]